jgi:P2-related tail formation protein
MSSADILPPNATPLMRALAEVSDPLSRLGVAYQGIEPANANPLPQFLPFLVWQYGLAELSLFLPNLYDLIQSGVRWQRERGTPAAIARGMGWLGYAGSLNEAPASRRRWNKFQIELDRVRDADMPDLARLEGIIQLSPPKRSLFTRGYRGYDIRAGELSRRRLSASLYSTDSGVRVGSGKAKWSFGRRYEADVTLTQSQLTALGVWLPPIVGPGLWQDNTALWSQQAAPWALPAVVLRDKAISEGIANQSAWLRFSDSAGTIGHARAVAHAVKEDAAGEYRLGSARFTHRTSEPNLTLVTGASRFGDGNSRVANQMSLVIGGAPVPGTAPGSLWLEPSQISGGTEVAATPVSIPFGLSVRERAVFVLRF